MKICLKTTETITHGYKHCFNMQRRLGNRITFITKSPSGLLMDCIISPGGWFNS